MNTKRMIVLMSFFILYRLSFAQEDISCEDFQSCAAGGTFLNAQDLKCSGTESCAGATFNIQCGAENCKIECTGDRACDKADITIDSAAEIICESCQGATFTVTAAADDFTILCKEPSSCKGMTLTATAGPGVDDFNEIKCEARSACEGASITYINNAVTPLFVEELICEAPLACKDLAFSLVGNVELEDGCSCGDQGGCSGATGIEKCYENLEKLECKGTTCMGQSIPLYNPQDDLEIICDDVKACFEAVITITIPADSELTDEGGVIDIKGVKCAKQESCAGLTVIVNNLTTNTVKVEKIECEDNNACSNAEFNDNNGGNVEFEEIKCDGNCGSGASACKVVLGGVTTLCTNV